MRVKIKNSVSEITEKINLAIAQIFDDIFYDILPQIEKEAKNITPYLWMRTDTYNSLISGALRGVFGLPESTAKETVDAIVYKAAESVKAEYNGVVILKSSFICKVRIYILKNDLAEILDMVESLVETEKQVLLPWLEWLVVQGDKIIINDYRYFPMSGKGRSLKGFMAKGKSFKVPSQHSGVLGDNWLTRALETYVEVIALHYTQEINKLIKARL